MSKQNFLQGATLIGFGIVVVTVVVGAGEKAKPASFPTIPELTSRDEKAQSVAVGKFARARRQLAMELGRIIAANTGKGLNAKTRAHACFLAGEMRMSDPCIVRSLVSVIDASFVTPATGIGGLPYGVSDPADALVKIGKPAVPELLNLLSTESNALRRTMALTCLRTIEGSMCAKLVLSDAVAAAKDDSRKANLQKVLKSLEKMIKDWEKEDLRKPPADREGAKGKSERRVKKQVMERAEEEAKPAAEPDKPSQGGATKPEGAE